VCDSALMTGFALGRKPVDRDTVLQVGRDFDLAGQATGDERRDVTAPARPGTVEQPQDAGVGAAPGMPEPEASVDQAPALFAEVGRPRRFSLFRGR
jgi:hypothetical protein